MTDQDRPKLSLGEPPGELKLRVRPVSKTWLWLVLVLQAAALACLAALWLRPAGASRPAPVAASTTGADGLRRTALALEERGLDAQAARAWEKYLQAAPDAPQRAEILYRAGKLRFDAQEYDEAAAALVRADLAAGDDRRLKTQIGRKLVDALRRAGRYGEVGRELSRQVEAGAEQTGRGKVLATLAGQSLTEADLDRMIERRVDNMLAMQGASGDAAARDALLKQLSDPAVRRQMLQDLLRTELFCRRARELKLDQHEEFLQARQQAVDALLAGRFLAGQLEKIQPTEVDLTSYYKANVDRYREPETLQAVLIKLNEGEDAAKVLAGIDSADDFRKLAAERPSDGASEGTPPSRRLVRGRDDPLLGPTDPLFALGAGQWTKAPHVYQHHRYLVLVDEKTPERTPPQSEVLDRVRADYVAQKRQELTEKLFGDLLSRYEVRIMPPGGSPQTPEAPKEDEHEEKTP